MTSDMAAVVERVRVLTQRLIDRCPATLFGPRDAADLHALCDAWEEDLPKKPWPGFDKDYDQDELCSCGHSYYRHFDWADNYAPGCKHCGCYEYKTATPTDADAGERCEDDEIDGRSVTAEHRPDPIEALVRECDRNAEPPEYGWDATKDDPDGIIAGYMDLCRRAADRLRELEETNTDYYERLRWLENGTDETETRLRGLLRSAEFRAEQAEADRDKARAERDELRRALKDALDAYSLLEAGDSGRAHYEAANRAFMGPRRTR